MWRTMITLLTNMVTGIDLKEGTDLYGFIDWLCMYSHIENVVIDLFVGAWLSVLTVLLIYLVFMLKELMEEEEEEEA